MTLEKLYSILNTVLKDKVFYGVNIYDNEQNAEMPYIVYQEINSRPIGYHDDEPIFYASSIQITLVTKRKTPTIEKKLEKALLENKINYSLTSEFTNADRSVNRVYDIKNTEEINNEQ